MHDDRQPITVAVAHRWEILRQGLAGVLRHSWPDCHVIEFADGEQIAHLAADEDIDIIIIDRDLPGLTGTEGITHFRDVVASLLVVLADDPDPEDVLDYLWAGASGYVSSRSTTIQFITCIETVLAGGIYAPSSLVHAARGTANAESPHVPDAVGCFTSWQYEVFQLLGEGLSTKSIARRLGLSIGTVKVHLASLYRRLEVHSRLEAVAKARELASTTHRRASGTPSDCRLSLAGIVPKARYANIA